MTLDVAKKVLTGNKFRVTPPNDFNDPFEMLPRAYSGMTEDVIYKRAEEKAYSYEYYQKITNQLNLDVTYEAYRAYLIQTPKIIQDVAADIKQSLENRDFTTLIDQVSQTLGVLCFTSEADNILMWSHYADDHKGVVIGFDSKVLSQNWFPVMYQDERIDIPFGASADSEEYKQAVVNILSTKFTTWGYEDEYRFFVKFDQCTKNQIGGKDMYFFELPQNCIKVVACGAKALDEDKAEIRKLFPNEVIDAKIDLKEFKVSL